MRNILQGLLKEKLKSSCTKTPCIRKKDLKALLNDNVCGEHCGICNFLK